MKPLNKPIAGALAILLLASSTGYTLYQSAFQKLSGTILYGYQYRSTDLTNAPFCSWLARFQPAQQESKNTYSFFRYSYIQFDPNHPQQVLYTDGKSITSEQTHLYPPSGETPPGTITCPRAIPGREGVSFVADETLYLYLAEQGKAQPAPGLSASPGDLFGADWLDENTLLYQQTADELSGGNILAYHINTRESEPYLDNAQNPRLSLNRKFLAYTQKDGTAVLRDLSDGSELKRKIADIGRHPRMVPSNDGNYLLFLSQSSWDNPHPPACDNQLVLIHLRTGARRTIEPAQPANHFMQQELSFLPEMLSWNEGEGMQ